MLVRSLTVCLLVALAPVRATAAPAVVEKLVAKLPAAQLKLFAVAYRSEHGVVGELRLNDVPVATFRGEGNSGSSNEVQGWLVPGSNRIDLVLTKLPTDSDELVRVSLHGLVTPGFPEDSNELVRVTIKKGTPPGPRAYVFDLPAAQAPPALLWKKAEVLTTVADADKKALRELGAAVLSSVQKGDAAAVRKLWAFSLEERARTTYSDPKEALAMIDQMLPEMKKAFVKATLASALDYTLVGGGRIVRVTRAGGAPPIAAQGDEGQSGMPINAAKIDGRWTLVP